MKILKNRRKIHVNIILSMIVLVIVLIMLIMGIFLVRNKMLQNTQNLGMALAASYAQEEESYIDSFKNVLEIGSQYVDQIYDSDNYQEIQEWLQNYFLKIGNMFDEDTIDFYGVIDGHIVAVNPWEGDPDYNYKETDWYRQAIRADGEIIFTDVYRDVITSQYIVTAAKALKNPGDVLVMDIHYRDLDINNNLSDLSDDCSIYLCDGKGNLINAVTKWNFSETEKEKSLRYLLDGIEDGSLVAYDSSFKDFDGENRGVYYHEMSNGWTLILTIPFKSVLMGEKNIPIYILGGVGVLLFVFLFIEVLREILMSRAIAKADNTIRILSESFYAIYRVDYKTGLYESIKRYDEKGEMPAKRGHYGDLLKYIKDHIRSEDCDEFEECFSLKNIQQRVEEGISDYGGDYKRNFNGIYKWVNIRTLYNKELAKEEVILCFREINAEKQQQQQQVLLLKETLDMLRESTRAKEIFFNNMSHDMRTPLNAIIGFSDLVIKHIDKKEKIMDYMGKIRYAGRHLFQLINDILELSRVQSNYSKVKAEPFNLRKCIGKCADLFEEQVKRENKTLKVRVDVQDEFVSGDAFKLEQILNNLIANAVKYSSSGDSVAVCATQLPYPKSGRYQIVVRDTGMGMSEEFLKHIFEPYAREMHFTRENVMGTGLGMFIVNSLVQQMNGEISIKSRLGEGSEITLVLPLAAVRQTDAEHKTKNIPEKKEYTLSGKRVLLAEDNKLNMEIAAEILHINGVEAAEAKNGEEAVRIFRESDPFWFDAILMDMQMPVMNGCEASKQIRAMQREDASGIPIIAVTANTFSEDMDKIYQAGMNGYITKPVNFEELMDLLKTLMEKQKNME